MAPRRLNIHEEHLTALLVTAAEGRWCEKCKVRHRPGTKCPYEGRGKGKGPKPVAPTPTSTPAAPKGPKPGLPPSGTVAPETAQRLQALIDRGVLPSDMTPAQHAELGKQHIEKHKASFPAFKQTLVQAAPPTARVMGRVKELDSMMGKITRKPKLYKSANDMTDLTGTRVICDSVGEVQSTVNNLKQQYEVLREEDYISQPNGNYRSHHLIVRDPKDGLPKEIQVRTENQNTWADWGHNIYKPLNESQKSAIRDHADEINDYAKQISDYFYQTDLGKPANKPPCTQVIHNSFGCL